MLTCDNNYGCCKINSYTLYRLILHLDVYLGHKSVTSFISLFNQGIPFFLYVFYSLNVALIKELLPWVNHGQTDRLTNIMQYIADFEAGKQDVFSKNPVLSNNTI